MIEINPKTFIEDGEVTFVASRSAGPGGQNVNKVSTRITLRFDLEASSSLKPGQKALIRERLATRINKGGVLQVSSQRHRTQSANKAAALERFADLLRAALEIQPSRRPTRKSRAVHRRRIEDKRHRGKLKQERSNDFREE